MDFKSMWAAKDGGGERVPGAGHGQVLQTEGRAWAKA